MPAENPDTETPPVFADLFKEGQSYEVPSYQRAYSWGDEQLKDFIHDLEEHPAEKPYYLGHFLFEKGKGGSRRFVIDGQQRLTTIMIFFIALHHHLDPDARQDFQPLADLYLAPSQAPRFLTVTPDRQTFENLRLGTPSDESETKSGRQILAAWQFFTKKFKSIENSKLHSWAQTLHTANVTEFEVKDKVQATQIFTLQNNRGKKLSPLELLKSYLMYQTFLHSGQEDDNYEIGLIETQFEQIYRISEQLELLDENAVLRYHIAAFSPYRNEGATDGLTRELDALPEPAQKLERIQQFSRNLAKTFQDAEILVGLIKNDEVVADPVILNAPLAWPLLLVLNRHYPGALSTDNQIRKLLRHATLTFFKTAFRHGKSRNVDYLITTVNEFHRNPKRNLSDLGGHLELCSQQGFIKYDDFNEAVLGHYQRNWHYDTETRFLLWKLENDSRDPHDRAISPHEYINSFHSKPKSNSIEHVTPQDPDWTKYSDEFASECLNNVGNFLLITQDWNSSLGNRPPEEKAQRFINSSLIQHRKVAEMIKQPCHVDGCDGSWCSHKIKQRQTEFIVFIERYLELRKPLP